MKTVKIAAFMRITSTGNDYDGVTEWMDWMDEDADYIRTSEIVTVELPDRDQGEVREEAVACLDEKIEAERAEKDAKIANLTDAKKKFQALTYVPADEG